MENGKKPENAFPWSRWILIISAVTFLMLGLDALLNHRNILNIKYLSLIPVVLSPLFFGYCVVAVLLEHWRKFAWVAGLLAIAIGLAGTLFHWLSAISQRFDQTVVAAVLESSRPPLAPAAFASAGLFLLLVAWADRRD